ncbi:MAG TPA: glycosyltransferase family 87 protein, partial [Flavobacteriales bacterium]|nr:glycosyltransferase family 87 protein [Flavobacteriales bacterium]
MRTPRSRTERILLLGISALLCGLLVNVVLACTNRNDLDIFLAAARELWKGGDPYAIKYHQWYTYYYSTFFAFLITPLLPLGAVGAKLVWGALTILLVFRCAKLLGLTGLRPVFFALLALFQPIRDNINASQMTVLVVWACLEGLHQVDRGRRIRAAVLIGAALEVKLIPLVLLPYLIYRRQWPV